MSVSYGPINVGSIVTLTCTVELHSAVDVPVTVNTVWTGPAGFIHTSTAQPVMESNTTYTSKATINSFGRDQSGNYICAANVTTSSDSLFLIGSSSVVGVATVTSGKQILSTQYSLVF